MHASLRPQSVIEVNAVTTVLGRSVIHRDLSLEVHSGEVLAIIGGSGSGKTTLLRLMLGLQRPAAGSVSIFGHQLGNCDATDLARVRNRWGVLFQQGALFSALTVFDNIALPLRELKDVPKRLISELVLLKLSQVGLSPADALKKPAELSGGMIKRVALARALILDPVLLFLDEPTAGLDPASSKRFVRLIEDLRSEMSLTVVMVTHDVDTLFALADRVAVLADRRLVGIGPLSEVAKQPHAFIQDFFLGHAGQCNEDYIQSYRNSLRQGPLTASVAADAK
ncbi:ATP-binding cassette domain-containing protein [Paucibacter sp. TC2R-5]|uniref:ABC transporter ATP-binding protein n=1 Tax=Paucibacter sp. TC2R-5 TaxID=2893555 RepID=UPI0021E35F6C|nr:ATP-binding cassette domain-containing protein [Paucibacter sp. TC2R-5]MCV2359302.1 ATP-binding cassette domain-containing protein [Paucibacter sp. TC2R-5]